MDPYLYVLLHKYDYRERVERAEQERLCQLVNPSPALTQRIRDLTKNLTMWRTHHLKAPHEAPTVEGQVVIY